MFQVYKEVIQLYLSTYVCVYTHTHVYIYKTYIFFFRFFSIIGYYKLLKGFPGGSEVKASACNTGDPGSIPGLGRSPGEGNGNPLQYFGLEKSHGRRSPVGCSPWDP